MNSEKKVGFLETVENGNIVKSSTRLGVLVMLFVSVAYLGFSVFQYYKILNAALHMVSVNPAFEASMLSLTQTLHVVDLGLFALLLLGWIAPKAIAKIAENKLK